MMKTVMDKHSYNALRTAINWYMRDKHIDVYENDGIVFGNNKPLTWVVNWSSIGSVSPAEAENFAKDLEAAITLARALNEMRLEYDYSMEDPTLVKMIEEDRARAFDTYNLYIELILETLPDLDETDPETFEPLEQLLFDFNWRF